MSHHQDRWNTNTGHKNTNIAARNSMFHEEHLSQGSGDFSNQSKTSLDNNHRGYNYDHPNNQQFQDNSGEYFNLSEGEERRLRIAQQRQMHTQNRQYSNTNPLQEFSMGPRTNENRFNSNEFEVIVKGIHPELNDIQIAAHFSNFAEVKSVKIERFKDGNSKGSCFIKFETFEGMVESIRQNGSFFMGKKLFIERTKSRSERNIRQERLAYQAHFRENNKAGQD
jgi:hypothetical protein